MRRKPWAFGVRDSHPDLRYSFRDSHFPALQQASRLTFFARGTLPYHAQAVFKGSHPAPLGFPAGFAPAEAGVLPLVPPAKIELSPLHLNIHGFGGRLEPRYIFGAESLDQ